MNATTAMRNIDQLDLEAIKVKLMHKESGEGWTLDHANAIEVEYRRFLCMMHLYPDDHFAPLVDVDTFWHYHILDTRKYAADCARAFGYFLHHHPYVGLGEDDADDHQAFGERMHALYQATFGEPCLSGAHAAAGASAWCSRDMAASTAWCSRETLPAQTAWCSLSTAGKASVARQTAWCSLSTAGKAGAAQKTAWCSLTPSSSAPSTAWCSLPQAAASTPGVGVGVGAAAMASAWCSRSPASAATAWCSARATPRLTGALAA